MLFLARIATKPIMIAPTTKITMITVNVWSALSKGGVTMGGVPVELGVSVGFNVGAIVGIGVGVDMASVGNHTLRVSLAVFPARSVTVNVPV